MPGIKCGGCGRDTNTAVSDAWHEQPYGEATKCYYAYVDGKWVHGCAYVERPDHMANLMEKEEDNESR